MQPHTPLTSPTHSVPLGGSVPLFLTHLQSLRRHSLATDSRDQQYTLSCGTVKGNPLVITHIDVKWIAESLQQASQLLQSGLGYWGWSRLISHN